MHLESSAVQKQTYVSKIVLDTLWEQLYLRIK